MPEQNRYRFSAIGTISLTLTVEADSPEEARKKAGDAGMQEFCHYCSTGEDDIWHTNGELDCMPRDVKFEGEAKDY